ncbi:protein shisa-like-1 [Ammospiza nelsoni]|uniref:protein shisa-like-1 n=1 Tax=Ammospiza nelsoni TaxID=2857394 RepID=UPI002869A35F|nr:protein shisa-like-1 [Ammospiza nelsoni]
MPCQPGSLGVLSPAQPRPALLHRGTEHGVELAACPAGAAQFPRPRGGGLFPALCNALLPAAVLVQDLHLCEGYVGPDGRSHPGFYCPRLTDPPAHRYCCQPRLDTLKSCCSQLALEALTGVNLSSLASPGLLRNPLALPFVGLYGLLVLVLMAIDLCHFYRSRRCRLRRLLPRGCCVPRGAPRGHPARTRAPHGAPRVTRPGRGC